MRAVHTSADVTGRKRGSSENLGNYVRASLSSLLCLSDRRDYSVSSPGRTDKKNEKISDKKKKLEVGPLKRPLSSCYFLFDKCTLGEMALKR